MPQASVAVHVLVITLSVAQPPGPTASVKAITGAASQSTAVAVPFVAGEMSPDELPDPLRRFTEHFTAQVRPVLERFLAAMDTAYADEPAEVRRAALVLFHTHHHGRHHRPPEPTPDNVSPWVERARERQEQQSHLLVLVRQHQELARLERLEYLALIETLRASVGERG